MGAVDVASRLGDVVLTDVGGFMLETVVLGDWNACLRSKKLLEPSEVADAAACICVYVFMHVCVHMYVCVYTYVCALYLYIYI